jgi:DNA-binding transcriptional ArsR family regulator
MSTTAPNRVATAVTEVFAALADVNRQSLYDQLLASGEMSATALADGATISRQAIVKHLQILESAGLATSERRGREVVYRPAATGITNLTEWLNLTTTRWQRRTAKLAAQTSKR